MSTLSNSGPVATLYYIHDPMCSWCWAFAPGWQQIRSQLPESVKLIKLLGGLAPDSDQPMAPPMQQYLQQTWQRIQQQVPGTEFNFEFWHQCQPRRSTYPACRAVIAAQRQNPDDPELDERMTRAIQQAYYLNARNPSDDATLIACADSLGLDTERFAADLNSRQTQAMLEQQIRQSVELGVQGFPSLVLIKEGRRIPIPIDYRNPAISLDAITQMITV
ncbi:DsbA family protein [Motiliproteus coralliicola]|uniref:DsbA family protein n=1 Tax=Motiliproteus coralliicola TaxID=2283196 RepID=A0A369WTS1_9GAMM|nr:DsbA family protein [Motiliproteus coralliicola]RDE22895.1 DsbA family protein [Motiliproteus coralliicola]